MARYRKKPIVIDALQYPGHQPTGEHVDKLLAFEDWLNARKGDLDCRYKGQSLIIPTLEGDHEAQPGDWIIQGVKGELYPCKPDIFAATYEPA